MDTVTDRPGSWLVASESFDISISRIADIQYFVKIGNSAGE